MVQPPPVPRDTPLSIRVEGFFKHADGNPVNATQSDLDYFAAYVQKVNDGGILENFTRTASLDSQNFTETFDAPNVEALAQGILAIPGIMGELFGSLGRGPPETNLISYTISGLNSEALNKTEDTSWDTLTQAQQASWNGLSQAQGKPAFTADTWNATFSTLHNINVNFISRGDSSKLIYA